MALLNTTIKIMSMSFYLEISDRSTAIAGQNGGGYEATSATVFV
jgi:hypothetical protein